MSREKTAFLEGFKRGIKFADAHSRCLAVADEEEEWQRYRCEDDSDWAAVDECDMKEVP